MLDSLVCFRQVNNAPVWRLDCHTYTGGLWPPGSALTSVRLPQAHHSTYIKPFSLKYFSAPGCKGADKPFLTMSLATRCPKAGCSSLKSLKLSNPAFTIRYTFSSGPSAAVTKD